jgi:DNA phosphorothioation-associated putative methyltransferase
MNNSHLAAPYRHRLSATADIVLKTGLLSPTQTHFDYGCGRGGDVEKLRELGFNSTGYDPYYFPNTVTSADVVTMSYVLNVIQDPIERRETLKNAWSLTKKHLIVSANVRGSGIHPGEITNLGTFTKYYNHIELKAYIESTLGYEALKLAKDKFLIRRDGRKFTPLHYNEVVSTSVAIAQSGWVAPMGTIIKGYCNDFKPRPGLDTVDSGEFPGRIRYYRLLAKTVRPSR